jgi:CDP-diacylglycerol--serine O-phosphatidyltransferase
MERTADVDAGPGTFRGRRIVRPHILPSLLTLGNLFCGFLAIAKASDALAVPHAAGRPAPAEMLALLEFAGWLIFLGMVFDALDGSVARMTGGASALGNVLDSLADVVTFGVAPAFLAKCLAEGVGGMQDRRVSLYFSVFFAAMAALRLARYSAHASDPEEAKLWFEGLPTPGAAGVVASLAILLGDPSWGPGAAALRLLPWAVLALALLMVSRLPFAHFTNRFLKGRRPVHYLVLAMAICVMSLAWNFEAVLAGALLLYALSGPAVGAARALRGRPAAGAGPAGGGGGAGGAR